MLRKTKRFSENICCLSGRRDMLNMHVREIYRANIMMTDVDVLRPRVFHIILDMIESRVRVSVDDCRLRDGEANRTCEFAEEDCFFCSIRQGDVFRFHGRESDDRLLVSRPRDAAIGEKEDVARM